MSYLRRRLRPWVIGLLVALVLTSSRTTVALAPTPISTYPSTAFAPVTLPSPLPSPSTLTISQEPSLKPSPTSGPVRTSRGIASWGDFGGHVVTRLPRGTRIAVVGPLGTWHGRSWGYGPAAYTGRIVDLDREVFRDICGDPVILGLCTVKLVIFD